MSSRVFVRRHQRRSESGRSLKFYRRPASDYDFEADFSRRLLAGEVRLEDYPYYADYVSTADAEAGMIRRLSDPRRVLFVGSGPLPLSAILLAKRLPGTRIDVMDVEPEALEVGSRVAEATGVRLDPSLGDVTRPGDLADYDVVVLALEAPLSRHDKRVAIRRLTRAITPQTLVLVRGACDPDDPAYVCSRDLLPRNVDVVGVTPIFGGRSETIVVRPRPKTRLLGEGAAPAYRQGL